ncbi:MAG: YgaP-like transmembrane domain [Chitinophagales bacterium]
MEYNMNFIDIVIHYTLMMVFVIIGGVLNSFAWMALGFAFYLVAILGWSPMFAILRINHCKNEEQH